MEYIEYRRKIKSLKKHKTTIACGVTAVVTTAITWKVSGVVMNHTFNQRYQALLLREVVLRDFVSAKGLKEEFLNEFIPSLN
jgi:hypothetical protein